VNAYTKISTERVFTFENTPVPTSLFHEDGTMLKCKTSDFMTIARGSYTRQDNSHTES